ncbi:MAG: acylphosphatase [Candidatus Caldarchaeum sp.]|nr:acylphosphatase [Candidatus Caldarchaeum sp.]
MTGPGPAHIRAEIHVDGDVQGVGFRYYVRRIARRQGITGYVENLEDGSVKIVCESTEERIKQFLETIQQAPTPIHVAKTSASYSSATGEFKTFKIVAGNLTEEMVEGFATGAAYFEVMFAKQDLTLSKQDQMLEKQDKMLEKQELMLRKQDIMIEKQDELLAEVRGVRNDLRTLLEQRISKIEKDIETIKSKIGLTT